MEVFSAHVPHNSDTKTVEVSAIKNGARQIGAYPSKKLN